MGSTEWLSNPSKGIVKAARPAQITMARHVEDILENGGIAFLEAGTGTGKTYGYGIPSILSGKRVIISTAKKTLQTQIFSKDLPLLFERMQPTKEVNGIHVPVTFGLQKGKSNYLCKLRLDEFQLSSAKLNFLDDVVDPFVAWAEQDSIGDFGLYSGEIGFENFVRVTECVKAHCPHVAECGYIKNKNRGGNAQILVVNHALLAYDLAMGSGVVLGPYDALIIDEAHQAPKFFREAFSFRMSDRQYDTLARLLDGAPVVLPDALKALYRTVFERLPDSGKFTMNTRLEGLFVDLREVLLELRAQFVRAKLIPEDGEGVVQRPVDQYQATDPDSARRRSKYISAGSMITRLLQMVKILLGEKTRTNAEGEEIPDPTVYISYTEMKDRGETPELVVTPLEVGPLVAPSLLHINRCVMTSATLSTEGNFNYAARSFGLHPKQIRIQDTLPSPFNYPAISALYVSQTAPEPSLPKADYLPSMAHEIHELLNESMGGAFVLCASYEDMNGIYEFLRQQPDATYRMMRQAGNVDQMLSWFNEGANSVLIGVKTLWEGLDVPGLGLRLVIIPRIPFPNRNDVVLTAQKELYVQRLLDQKVVTSQQKGDLKAWADFDLQEAIMDLKQGAGRLIRRETDKGVVAILDRRMVGTAKAYSGKLRTSLPQPTTYEKKGVLNFLRALATVATK